MNFEPVKENGGGRVKVIATAPGNQTYAAQLAYLKPYFDTLSIGEKMVSSLAYLTSGEFHPCIDITGGFEKTVVISNGSGGYNTVVAFMSLPNAKLLYGVINNPTDISSSVTTAPLSLCIPEY